MGRKKKTGPDHENDAFRSKRRIYPYIAQVVFLMNQLFLSDHGLGSTLDALRRWWGNVESGVFCHHALETDTDALDDGEQDGATDGTVAHGLVTTTDSKSTTGEETGNDGVPGVFLLAVL